MIGIFDSGIGGLTVVKAVMDQLPGYDIVYFGDTARTPYGNKSPQTIKEYALQDTQFLLSQGANLILMACNTASSTATDAVSGKFPVPVFEVITPAVQLAAEKSKHKTIGVIGTRATVQSGIYEYKLKKIDAGIKVYQAPCPLLVPLVEEGWIKKPETTMIIKKYLYPLKLKKIDTLILGCTHYPVLKKKIQKKVGRHVHLIDSSITIAENLKRFLNDHPEIDCSLSKNNIFNCFVSDTTDQFEKVAKKVLEGDVSLQQARL